MPDSDTRGDADVCRGNAIVARFPNGERRLAVRYVGAVVHRPRDAHRQGQLSRTIGQLARMPKFRPTSRSHDVLPINWFQRTDENAACDIFRLRDQVQTFVHPIDEVDIGVPRRTENDTRARRDAAGRMGRQIPLAQVRLDFDNTTRAVPGVQNATKQVFGNGNGVAGIKRSGQNPSDNRSVPTISMRLFTGLDLPPAIAGTLGEWQDSLRRECAGVSKAELRWSPAGNFHITTKFIGDWPETRLAELIDTLDAAVPRPSRFTLRIPGMDSMTNAHHGRIVYAQVDCPNGPVLERLAQDTSRALYDRLGIAPEEQAYRPHVTLGRSRHDDPRLQAALAAGTFSPLTFEATEFCLYRSDSGPNGTVYSKLSCFPFAS